MTMSRCAGSSVADSAGIREYVDRRLGMPSSVLNADEWLSGGQQWHVDAALEKQQLLFVQSMLCENAEARPSACRALDGAFFEPASDIGQLRGGIEVRRPSSRLFANGVLRAGCCRAAVFGSESGTPPTRVPLLRPPPPRPFAPCRVLHRRGRVVPAVLRERSAKRVDFL